MCVLDPCGLEQSQMIGLCKNYKIYSGRRGESVDCISTEDCSVNVIRTTTRWNKS